MYFFGLTSFYFCENSSKAKIEKLFVSCTRPTVRKRWVSKYVLGDLRRLFVVVFFGLYWKSWLEVPILFQNLRSELVYTFKWTKSIARLWRNQICEWTQHLNMLKLRCWKKKKTPPTYRPIGEMEGRVRETNIFLRVAQLFAVCCYSERTVKNENTHFPYQKCITWKMRMLISCTGSVLRENENTCFPHVMGICTLLLLVKFSLCLKILLQLHASWKIDSKLIF